MIHLTTEVDSMTEQNYTNPTVESRIPITWIVSTVGTILTCLGVLLWNVAGQSSKLDTLVVNSVKSDTKVEVLKEALYSLQRVNDTNTLRITVLESHK
jgi:hypothetical protein